MVREPLQAMLRSITPRVASLLGVIEEIRKHSVPFQQTHKILSRFTFIGKPVGQRLVVGLDDFAVRLFRDRKQRAEGTGEVAELFVLPVEEVLEDFQRQRFAGGEDGAQRRGAHVFAEFIQVGEIASEIGCVFSAKPCRKLLRAIHRIITFLDIFAKTLRYRG